MSYDHAQHAGNAGDVWKHFCLLEAVKAAVSGTGLKKRSYFESHCGAGRFDLAALAPATKPIPPELSTTDYFQTAFYHLAKREYLGSWRWAETTGAFANYFLCDSNAAVIETAKEVTPSTNAKQFHFAVSDGFERIEKLEPMDFVFIDPPYESSSDWDRLQAVLPSLKERQPHFLIWYPIFSEGQSEKVFPGLERLEIRWAKDSADKNRVGCGITGSRPCTTFLRDLSELDLLARWLSASFRYCK